jgi:ferric-dicitrate binding protein FerR (iron transport regulator)
MENKLNIDNLIAKLQSNNLTSEEFSELLKLIRSEMPENQMKDYLGDAWKKVSNMNQEVNSDDLLDKIHSKIQLTDNTSLGVAENASQNTNTRILKVMRYAAILIIAFVLSWVAQNAFRKGTPQINNISYNEVSVSYGSKSKIVLPDGTKVSLNSGSKIRYPSHFENDRSVFIEGEVFFDVKKDAKHPFYVNTSDITIKVLGTVFNVKSYPEEKIIETTLVSGSVQIFDNKEGKQSDRELNQQIAVLAPNQKAIFVKNNREMTMVSNETKEQKTAEAEIEPISAQMLILNKVKTEVTTSWKDNKLVFDNEKFERLLPKLERWYNLEIINDYPALNNTRFTGKFDLETIEQALKALQITTPFNFTMDKNKLKIFK